MELLPVNHNITIPFGIGLMDWADQIVLDLENQTALIKLLDVNDWQDWAVQFVTAPGLSGYNVPNPYEFDDWQVWASGFCKAIQA